MTENERVPWHGLLSDDGLNRFCAEKIMGWTEFSGIYYGSGEWKDTPMMGVRFSDNTPYWDPLTNPLHSGLLLDRMARKWCTEVSSRDISANQKQLLEHWTCYFWDPLLKGLDHNRLASFLGDGAMHRDSDRKRAIVVAAWKAETGQFTTPESPNYLEEFEFVPDEDEQNEDS